MGRRPAAQPSPIVGGIPLKAPLAAPEAVRAEPSLLTEEDLYLFNEGTHTRLYEKLGAHPIKDGRDRGTHFAVWAPNASRVSVIGDFNAWRRGAHPLRSRGVSGVWEGFVPGVPPGTRYKYHIQPNLRSGELEKADPVGFRHEVPPATASIVHDLSYAWQDASWMRERGDRAALSAPQAIYEVHLGSWRRVPEEGNRPLTYRELAPLLIEHVTELGFTHVEFLPLTEHPFYGSWGYLTTGYFAPTARYGSPQDLMALVDQLHQNGIGVLLDWVPSHFPIDAHGLGDFDGTHLFEHEDPRQGFHPDWKSYIFNYGRHEVRSFLLSSAFFWLDRYHADGLRVDAVASMLYRDYSRGAGEWVPNVHGGRENLEAIAFLRKLNEEVYRGFPGVQTIAEESTAWPMVSRPTYVGGLGFGLKWDMGWMHDTLEYLGKDPVHRKYHHGLLTFRAVYQYSENFVLPLSHDEVVHGKGSLLAKMPGDLWQRFANLRLLYGYQFTLPGKKLLFMGGEFGPDREWDHDSSLDWHAASEPLRGGLRRWLADVARLYRSDSALHEGDAEPWGFEWVDCGDAEQSVIAFLRRARDPAGFRLVVANFTSVPRRNYRLGVPVGGPWRELLNSDATSYGGSGQGNLGRAETGPVPLHGRPASLTLTLPPLGLLVLAPDNGPLAANA